VNAQLRRLMFVAVPLLVSATTAASDTYPDRESYFAKLENLPVTAQTPAEIRYHPVSVGTWFEFELGGEPLVADFGSGKAFYLALRLPQIQEQLTLEIRSELSSITPRMAHAVKPTVLFFDDQYQLIFKQISPMMPTKDEVDRMVFMHDLPVSEAAQYVILFADPAHVDDTVTWWHVATAASGWKNEMSQSRVRTKIGVGGPIRLVLRSKQPVPQRSPKPRPTEN